MTQRLKIVIGMGAFILFILGATFAYGKLRDNINPEIILGEEPGNILPSDSQGESNITEEDTEPELIKAFDFTVEDVEGNQVKLSDMEGKPVVLNFWASWCPPCKAEMPEFDTVYAELGNEVTFMMVNLTDGQRETKEKGMDYISGKGFSFPVYYDTKQEASYSYGIRSIPTTIFINSSGYVVTGAEGQIDEKTLRYGIDLIKTKDEPTSSDEIITEYQKISAKEAYKKMEEMEDFILLDVRTQEEYQEQHIKGALLIPDYELSDRAESELPDKNAVILIYCRSGRRSELAAKELIDKGYTNVFDFGGIIDWPYDTK